MNGRMEYTRKARPVPCNCCKCFHARVRAGALYCAHYDKLWPDKRRCARFKDVKGKFLGIKRAKPNTSAGR